MRETWNALVAALEKDSGLIEPSTKGDRRKVWTAHREICRRIVAESGLNWECGPAILDRFDTACRMAYRGERGWPKQQCGLNSVMIPHCYTSGGIPVSGLFGASRRLAMKQVPPEAYTDSRRETVRRRLTRGVFGFDGGAIEFEAILHRPIPGIAFIKGCAWVGKRHPFQGWQWSIAINVEEPPVRLNGLDLSVAVDIGWRVFPDAIRVATAVDESGVVRKLRLPHNAARAHERRHNIPAGWRDLPLLDSEISNLLQSAKAELSLLAAHESVRNAVDFRERVEHGDLASLLCQLEQNGEWPEALDVLRKWKSQNDRLRAIRSALSARLIGRRRWLYRNFAAQLCRSYRQVVMKQLPIKSIQSADLPGARYRQWASPGELAVYLRQAAKSYGALIIEARPGFSTTTCAQCGAQAIQTGRVVLTCENGHSWDQDENAARNLLSQLEPDSRQSRYIKDVHLD